MEGAFDFDGPSDASPKPKSNHPENNKVNINKVNNKVKKSTSWIPSAITKSSISVIKSKTPTVIPVKTTGVTTSTGINVDDALSFLDDTPPSTKTSTQTSTNGNLKRSPISKSDDQLLSDMLGDALLQTQVTTTRIHNTWIRKNNNQNNNQNSKIKVKVNNNEKNTTPEDDASSNDIDTVLDQVSEMQKSMTSFLQTSMKTSMNMKTSMKHLNNMYYYHALAAELSKYDDYSNKM